MADDEATSTSESELAQCGYCGNCVDHARCRQPRLPHNLISFQDKLRIINTGTPRRGCVAVIDTGSAYGHVAHVYDVRGSTVFIDEGNWPSGQCGRRRGTEASLNIRGYFCP